MITMGDQRDWVSVQLCSLVYIIWERSFSLWVQGRSYPKTCFCWTSMSGVGTFNYVTFDLQPKNGLEHWTRSTFFCCTKASKPDSCVFWYTILYQGVPKLKQSEEQKAFEVRPNLGYKGGKIVCVTLCAPWSSKDSEATCWYHATWMHQFPCQKMFVVLAGGSGFYF